MNINDSIYQLDHISREYPTIKKETYEVGRALVTAVEGLKFLTEIEALLESKKIDISKLANSEEETTYGNCLTLKESTFLNDNLDDIIYDIHKKISRISKL